MYVLIPDRHVSIGAIASDIVEVNVLQYLVQCLIIIVVTRTT